MTLMPTPFHITRKHGFIFFAGTVALLGLVFWLLARWLSPAPPGQIDMTTGPVDGASHQFAVKYQALLKASHVTLRLLPSSGAVQNLERLNAGTPVGFVQGGLNTLAQTGQAGQTEIDDLPLRTLGVVGYEPIWIFTRAPSLAKTLAKGLGGLAGKKVAIGASGSGTRKVALDVLGSYGITTANAGLESAGGLTAANALLAHQLDAVFTIGAPSAPAVQLLLNRADVQLVSLEHAEGLSRKLNYLSVIKLPAGAVDAAQNLPPQDVALLTTTANLVVREDLHPAIGYLLLEAAREVHRGATLLNRPGEFPRLEGADFTLSEGARRYYKDGRPFLQRYVPYWVANAVQRLLLVLVPLLAVAIPLFKYIPQLIEFKQKSRLNRCYGLLLDMEHQIRSKPLNPEEAAAATDKLGQIERDVSSMKFPLDFTDRVYTLRQHVDYVRGQLHKDNQAPAALTG